VFQTKVAEKILTHLMINTFLSKIFPFMR